LVLYIHTTSLLSIMAIWLVAILLTLGACADDRPNIVFLVVESTDGRTWTPGYQNDVLALPNIRRLQRGGVEFRRHYANTPVCCPSRASFWSGRHAHNIPHEHGSLTVGGTWNNYEGLAKNFSDRIDQVLTREGYNVLVSGKKDWDTGGHGESAQHTDLALWTMYAQFPYDLNTTWGWRSEATGGECDSEGTVKEGAGTESNAGDWKTLRSTIAWIETAATSQQPFFVYQGMNIVHPAYVTNSYWYDQIDPDLVDVPEWAPLEQMHPCDLQSSMLKGCIPPIHDKELSSSFYSADRRKRIRRIYLAMISEFDAMVGAYMDTVQKAGVWNNTVWIVTSDHGDMQMEHQQFYKMAPYDASASVPMVILDGRRELTESAVVAEPTSLVDVYPTIMELAQVRPESIPPALDGFSLTPFMERPMIGLTAAHDAVMRPSFVVSQFHGKNLAMSWFLVVQPVRNITYKLIIWGTGKEVPSLLFDLDRDSGENDNLLAARDGTYDDVFKELTASLRSVVDYPAVAQDVAQYNKDVFIAQFKNLREDWETALATQSYWKDAWSYNASGALAAVHAWLEQPAKVLPCRSELVTPMPPNFCDIKLAKAVTVAGAGLEGANGVYERGTTIRDNMPMFEKDEDYQIYRFKGVWRIAKVGHDTYYVARNDSSPRSPPHDSAHWSLGSAGVEPLPSSVACATWQRLV